MNTTVTPTQIYERTGLNAIPLSGIPKSYTNIISVNVVTEPEILRSVIWTMLSDPQVLVGHIKGNEIGFFRHNSKLLKIQPEGRPAKK
jgi:hypothetical protein